MILISITSVAFGVLAVLHFTNVLLGSDHYDHKMPFLLKGQKGAVMLAAVACFLMWFSCSFWSWIIDNPETRDILQ